MKTRNGTGYENTAVPWTRGKRVKKSLVEMDAAGTSTLETTTGESPPSNLSPLTPSGSNAPLRNLPTENNDSDSLPNEGGAMTDGETDDSSTTSRSSENIACAHAGLEDMHAGRSRLDANVEPTDHSRYGADVASRGSASSDMQLVSENENPIELRGANPSYDGFEMVTRSNGGSRPTSPRTNSPVASEPRNFQRWFNKVENH